MLWMTLFWLGLILVVVWAVRWATRNGGSSSRSSAHDERGDGDRALRILEERLARGDIDPEEFEERRRILRGS